MINGFLGIDAGTQGLSVVLTDENLHVVATGEGGYDMLPDRAEGCYEQSPEDWESALSMAMQNLRDSLNGEEFRVVCIGVSGQMHGEVLADADGKSLGPVRLWCDSRNESEGEELTTRFGVKMPKRITSARWLWTLRNHPELARRVAHLTTPSGWLAYRLTGQWILGVGDAAGMFPVDQETLDYRQSLLESFDQLTPDGVASLKSLLPEIRRAGQDGGMLNEQGAKLLGLAVGIPVAPAEGDQPASLAGSLIGESGMVSVSFGTSVCANAVGDRHFEGVSAAVDHFCAPDGKPINMVWLRNGTTFMNTVVQMLGSYSGDQGLDAFAQVMPEIIAAEPECGGILALPFMDDEPGLSVSRGGTAQLIGLNSENATPGNAGKAALLATMFNLRKGCEELDHRGFPRTEIVLAGGITRTPETGQILADVFNTPVTMLESAEEGTAWGAAVMASYRFKVCQGDPSTWSEFLTALGSSASTRFEPDPERVPRYEHVFLKYKKLLLTQPDLNLVMGG